MKRLTSEDIIFRRFLPDGCPGVFRKVMSTPPSILSKDFEAAILIKGGSCREEGWDIPEGYGIEKIPGKFCGKHDPDLWKIIEERDSN